VRAGLSCVGVLRTTSGCSGRYQSRYQRTVNAGRRRHQRHWQWLFSVIAARSGPGWAARPFGHRVLRMHALTSRRGGISPEAFIRDALRRHVLSGPGRVASTIDEFWVPRSHERADMAAIGRSMDGYEIKSERDSLRRLPRQIHAYGRLFDHCTVVVAGKHSEQVIELLPDWWGILVVESTATPTPVEVRRARTNPSVDSEILVRLLWRDEAMSALVALGHEPDRRASRGWLWQALLGTVGIDQLKSLVRDALLGRHPAQARIATRRFTSHLAALEAGR
jgi:hypothetical protein